MARMFDDPGSGATGASNVWRAYGPRLGITVVALDLAEGFRACPRRPHRGLAPAAGSCRCRRDGGPCTAALPRVSQGREDGRDRRRGGDRDRTLGRARDRPIWIVTFALWRYTSLASLAAAVGFPIAAVLLGYPAPVVVFARCRLAARSSWLHRPNLAAPRRDRAPRPSPPRRLPPEPCPTSALPSSSGSPATTCVPRSRRSGFAKTLARSEELAERDARFVGMIDEAAEQLKALVEDAQSGRAPCRRHVRAGPARRGTRSSSRPAWRTSGSRPRARGPARDRPGASLPRACSARYRRAPLRGDRRRRVARRRPRARALAGRARRRPGLRRLLAARSRRARRAARDRVARRSLATEPGSLPSSSGGHTQADLTEQPEGEADRWRGPSRRSCRSGGSRQGRRRLSSRRCSCCSRCGGHGARRSSRGLPPLPLAVGGGGVLHAAAVLGMGLHGARRGSSRPSRCARVAALGGAVRPDAVRRGDRRAARALVRARDRSPAHGGAASDARIPGLERDEAARLRDRLAALGEAQAAGCEQRDGVASPSSALRARPGRARDDHARDPARALAARGAGLGPRLRRSRGRGLRDPRRARRLARHPLADRRRRPPARDRPSPAPFRAIPALAAPGCRHRPAGPCPGARPCRASAPHGRFHRLARAACLPPRLRGRAVAGSASSRSPSGRAAVWRAPLPRLPRRSAC